MSGFRAWFGAFTYLLASAVGILAGPASLLAGVLYGFQEYNETYSIWKTVFMFIVGAFGSGFLLGVLVLFLLVLAYLSEPKIFKDL